MIYRRKDGRKEGRLSFGNWRDWGNWRSSTTIIPYFGLGIRSMIFVRENINPYVPIIGTLLYFTRSSDFSVALVEIVFLQL